MAADADGAAPPSSTMACLRRHLERARTRAVVMPRAAEVMRVGVGCIFLWDAALHADGPVGQDSGLVAALYIPVHALAGL